MADNNGKLDKILESIKDFRTDQRQTNTKLFDKIEDVRIDITGMKLNCVEKSGDLNHRVKNIEEKEKGRVKLFLTAIGGVILGLIAILKDLFYKFIGH